MDLIDEFIAQYTKEYDFYAEASRLAAEMLESDLRAAGVRSLVTFRAKSITRLEEKCRKRHRGKKYQTPAQIYDDIVDLAGVRVALYYPDESDQLDKAIGRLFRPLEPKKEFAPGASTQPNRFPGYTATHYRVQLAESDLSESQQRYSLARIEIQVASVLMHAWSEVEHDLIYKPLQGELSEQEHRILDQLNGLVHAGEVALQLLQKAAELRVSSGERVITNHYDLAAFLLNRIGMHSEEPVTDAELGRVDLLFELLLALDLNTPTALDPYLEILQIELERRPIAEQLVDGLLGDNLGRYTLYRRIREDHQPPGGRPVTESQAYDESGRFLAEWSEFEADVRDHVGPMQLRGAPIMWILQQSDLLTEDEQDEITWLRRVRNHIVHGEMPSVSLLERASSQLAAITSDLRQRRSQSA
ncbi:RelA/SpoT family protein [Kribbella antiqua]|uniref:RelA/SpoT family protein n=1 Tax=Kribbella antiqua TaxID=2512217 RepID=A0A4R2IP57_9ACTN|nr:RelA/SpoT domain-containing protein [Kribbella antiqua]TCO44505.1 RelA/SpoT family protein [Kribbella antiqua]